MSEGRWNAATARRVLGAWRESGLSMAAFGRANGLRTQRLSWWRKRLEAEGVAPLAFIPAAVTGGARVAVRLPGGIEVEAADVTALPASWIAALAREIAEAS